ncbi:hypothetical protein CONLIGDRAFT_634369 [Coniochaeta ligniaria NRRL 30616]|uniref:Uncharacterized protein n=1 Tax=Coniochaeta ligniaria NRRL 30616 TaxID=1408157 RepID=A0A1J7JEB8_9PEZI|nr:hypothetical protein CONLIGDRAFT_634369 [Coniochaeta ligniaria NRRL 30616]
MCLRSQKALETAQAKALAAQSNPSPCAACNEHSPAQLVTLVHAMSRTDFRQLKHEVKQEKRAIKAEMKAYQHENKADWKMAKHERKAMKHAIKAQLWSDVIARHGQRQREGSGQVQGEVVEYQTLRDDGEIQRGVVSLPPGYDEVNEKKDMNV